MVEPVFFLLIVLLIGFAIGYGVREWLSRRRHAAERKKYHETHGD
jgi:hypothetical protein